MDIRKELETVVTLAEMWKNEQEDLESIIDALIEEELRCL